MVMKFYLMVKAAGDSPIAFLIKKGRPPNFMLLLRHEGLIILIINILIIFVAC